MCCGPYWTKVQVSNFYEHKIIVIIFLIHLYKHLYWCSKEMSQGDGSFEGAQWLSGRVLDSRPKGSGFEPHQRHCVVVLEQDTFILA